MATELHDLTAAYALHALEGEELATFEEHLADCERCREEVVRLAEAAGLLAYGVPAPEPPAALRERILDSARSERGRVIEFPRRRRFVVPGLAVAAAAAAAVAIGLGVWANSLSNQLGDIREVLGDPHARSIALQGAEGRLVVAQDGRAALVVSGLDKPPSGKTYEIWVIEGQKPRRAGLFEHGDKPVLLDETVPDDATVAVTIENDGGVDAPTGEPILSARA